MAKKISLAIVLLWTLPAFAREEYTRDFDQTVALPPGNSVRVAHKLGDVVIRTQTKPEVTVHAVIRVSAGSASDARRYADDIRIDVRPIGNSLLIETRYPKQEGGFFGFHNVSYSVNYDIAIPETAPLEVRNSFGAVSISDLKAGAAVTNSHGRLAFRNGRGRQRLENSFAPVEVAGNDGDVTVIDTNGNVDVSDVKGAIEVRDRFGKVSLSRVGGGTVANGNGAVQAYTIGDNLRITTSFGPVNAREIKGNLTVNNTNGSVEADNVTGNAELNTSFAAIRFSGIGGQLSVRANNAPITGRSIGDTAAVQTSFAPVEIGDARKGVRVISGNGSVTLTNVTGEAWVKTSFGLVKADRVGGTLTIENNNGAVTAYSIKGSANVRTSFAPVTLDGVAGATDVQNQNGTVEVTTARQQTCKPVTVRTSFSPLRVHVPADAGYAVTARTSYGRINSELPMTVTGVVSGDSLSGKIGNGACPMQLTNNNGPIEIMSSRR